MVKTRGGIAVVGAGDQYCILSAHDFSTSRISTRTGRGLNLRPSSHSLMACRDCDRVQNISGAPEDTPSRNSGPCSSAGIRIAQANIGFTPSPPHFSPSRLNPRQPSPKELFSQYCIRGSGRKRRIRASSGSESAYPAREHDT